MRKILTALLGLSLAATAVTAIGSAASADDQGSASSAGTAAPGKLVFADEFDGSAIDRDKWAIHSNAEADQCLGNKGNQELEWHTWDALSVANGVLTITARKNNPHPGYEWSSGLITTGQACGHEPRNSFAVQPGDYVETRLKLPAARGFWPSTWTWNGNGSNEQDTYEFYSDNHTNLYLTNHQAGGGSCTYESPADLTKDWHTIAQQLGPDRTTWYLDGRKICEQGAYSGTGDALILDRFVYSKIPPTVTEESMQIDHVRVYRP
ncbi:glycosyl hydrolase family 16 [Kribbella amoyensis]|uniref:Glycosyl hydrolase family 16 n=1 Tax=Kribbella amoyensis TaxID=996641 RepID=A0A561BU86_9ACTN|nr:glycoside hydrolase family 16 protein [Kribbella amoyensis]TWD82342.1 glycosyl hydrolase family 16 [Kribbella amoyensis]